MVFDEVQTFEEGSRDRFFLLTVEERLYPSSITTVNPWIKKKVNSTSQ